MTALDFQALLPLIILAAGSGILLVYISFFRNFAAAFGLTVSILLGSIFSLGVSQSVAPLALEPMFKVDGFGIFYQGILLIASLVTTCFAFDYFRKFDDTREEFFVLILLATLGAGSLAISNHFISFFLGLELLSVPLYALVAYTYTRENALEAGIKYLLLAAASSAFLLFGMALLYAELGTMEFSVMSISLSAISGVLESGIILAGLALVLSGIAFKLSLVPFHWWTPDVYQGAPAPVAGFLATVSKGAVVAVGLRFAAEIDMTRFPAVYSALGSIIFLSIAFGNLLALGQQNLKRLLAYSSIAHMGYLAIAFLAGGQAGVEAATLYMVGYLLTSLGTFGVLSALSTSENEVEELSGLRGLYWKRPGLASLLTLFMLSLAGIPLTAGFIGKFMIVTAGAQNFDGLLPLLITLAAGSAIGLVYYLRVVWTLFQKEETSTGTQRSLFAFGSLIAVSAAILIVGVFPSPLLKLMNALSFGVGF